MSWDNTFVQDQTFDIFVRNTLDKYPFGVGVFQEWIANADDAKASEFKVALDTPSVPYNSSVWGGPSILIFNNQIFSPNDWVGFTKKLGNSGKRNDADSIGKFGLGSITFYHISDLISVVSGDQVLILDMPRQDELLQNKSIKGSYLQDISKFSHVLDPISQQQIFPWDPKTRFRGTIFRLPIRLRSSNMRKNIIAIPEVEKFLIQCVEQAPDQLHFLQNVELVEIWLNKNEKAKRLVQISLPISNEVRSKRQRVQAPKERISNSSTSCVHFQYITKVINENSKESVRMWHVFLGDAYLTYDEKERLTPDGNLDKMAPRGGIAVNLDMSRNERPTAIKGKGYCFLPILKEFSGLPIHVNGLFQLNDNRTDIWMTTDSDYRTRWNKFILEKVIAPLWAYAISQIAEKYKDNNITYDLFPKKLQHPWSLASSPTFSFFQSLPIFKSESGIMVSATDAFFCDDPASRATYRMLGRKCLLPYVDLSEEIVSSLRAASIHINHLSPKTIHKLLTQDASRVQAVRDLPLQDKVTLAHTLKSIEMLYGLPLMPMLDGSFRIVNQKVKESTFIRDKNFIMKMIVDWGQLVDHTSDMYQRVEFLKAQCQPLSARDIESKLPRHWKGSICTGRIDPTLDELIENNASPLFAYAKEIGKHLLVLPLDNGEICSVEHAKMTCVLFSQFYPNKTKIINLLATKFGMRVCRRYPPAIESLAQECLSKNVVFAAFNYYAFQTGQSFATLMEQCQDRELINDMFEAPLPDKQAFSSAKILQTQNGSFIAPKDAILLDNNDWLRVLEDVQISVLPIDKVLAAKLGVKSLNDSDFFLRFLMPNMDNFSDSVKDAIMRLMVIKYNEHCSPKILSYLTKSAVVKADNNTIKISDLVNDEPEIVAFFTNDLNWPILPYAWKPLKPKLHLFGFESLPITRILDQIPSLLRRDPVALRQRVLTLIDKQSDFTLLKPHRIFPIAEPSSAIHMLQLVKSTGYFLLDEMDDPAHTTLVWTVRPLLHPAVNLGKAIHAGLRKQPLLKDVIRHFKNVVSLLHSEHYAYFMASDWDFVISTILRFLSQHVKSSQIKELENLEFIRVGLKFVRPSRLCFDLQEDYENEAYFKVPNPLRQFRPLLEVLGAETGLGENANISLPPTPNDDKRLTRNMLEQLAKSFDNPDSFVDVEFKVEGRSIFAHRLILSLHSQKFRVQFTGKFLDAMQHQGAMLVISEGLHTSYNALRFLLTYLYTGTLDFKLITSPDEWVTAVQLSSEHFLNDLKTHLEIYILTTARYFITTHTVCHLMSYAELFKMKFLATFCRDFALKSKRAIFALPEFGNLEESLVKNLFGEEGWELWSVRRISDAEVEGDATEEDDYVDLTTSTSHLTVNPNVKPAPAKIDINHNNNANNINNNNNTNNVNNNNYSTYSPSAPSFIPRAYTVPSTYSNNNNNHQSWASIATSVGIKKERTISNPFDILQPEQQPTGKNSNKKKKNKKKVLARFG